MSSSHPSERPAHIATLIDGVDRYNPSNCHLLEEYLQLQLSSDSYDLLANLALLKLYQFNPTLLSPSATLSILFLSLSHAPFNSDFTLAWSLLSDSFVAGAALPPAQPTSDDDEEDDVVPAQDNGEKLVAERLRALSGFLQARQFRAFWKTLRQGEEGEDSKVKAGVHELLGQAKGFEERVRQSISQEVGATFKGVQRKTIESFLGLEAGSPALQPLADKYGWTLTNDEVKLPKNDSNSPTSSVTNEKISIDQLSRLLGRTQA
ncbi:armadillo-type protein [Leucosporidium creatinivorum]|uniref:Eukaryotic translation initiation factor 3 subunit K n=1 Tax=Leucosporidium creatinivorum TaxID=106004 RepID=A0A1Y2F2C2_9BASI|nr:armadillo-type protein [Leucosporidium creatinivorum]